MSWVALGVAVVGMVMQQQGQAKAAEAAQIGAQNQQLALNAQAQQNMVNRQYEADQMRQAAGQEQASAQRMALEEQRRARLIASRALALAGASGAGASDPTVMNLLADLEGEGAYRSGVAMYEGESRSRQLLMGADAKEFEGRSGITAAGYEGRLAVEGGANAAGAYRTQALGMLAKGGESLYAKYGNGGPSNSNYSWAGTFTPTYTGYDATGGGAAYG